MNKIMKKIALVCALSFALIASFGSAVHADQLVLKTYTVDVNRFTSEETRFDEKKEYIPDNYVFYSEERLKWDSGWNYDRYLATRYYKLHQSII